MRPAVIQLYRWYASQPPSSSTAAVDNADGADADALGAKSVRPTTVLLWAAESRQRALAAAAARGAAPWAPRVAALLAAKTDAAIAGLAPLPPLFQQAIIASDLVAFVDALRAATPNATYPRLPAEIEARQHQYGFHFLAVHKKVASGKRNRTGPAHHGAEFKHGVKLHTVAGALRIADGPTDAKTGRPAASYLYKPRGWKRTMVFNGGWHLTFAFATARAMVRKAQSWMEGQAPGDARRNRAQDVAASWCRWKRAGTSIFHYALSKVPAALRMDVPAAVLGNAARWRHLIGPHLDDCNDEEKGDG